MDPKKIKVRCNRCGSVSYEFKFCPLTGHRYGNSWERTCQQCRGTQVVVTHKSECQKTLEKFKPFNNSNQEESFNE